MFYYALTICKGMWRANGSKKEKLSNIMSNIIFISSRAPAQFPEMFFTHHESITACGRAAFAQSPSAFRAFWFSRIPGAREKRSLLETMRRYVIRSAQVLYARCEEYNDARMHAASNFAVA